MDEMITVYLYGKKYTVPSSLTIMEAFEYSGYQLVRGCGCRNGFCGACATIYRIKGETTLHGCLACSTKVEDNMCVASLPFFPLEKEIYNIEDMITDCEKKKEAAKQDVLTKENVFKMLLVFDKIFDKMNDADKRKLLESMIAEVHLHPKDTWQEGKNPIKEIKYAFPVSQEVMEALRENVASVETCVLLCRADT